jgi:NAD-dependent DNA ligase
MTVTAMADQSDNFGNIDSRALKQSLGELLGIARGLLADNVLSNDEIHFLRDWLDEHNAVSSAFPGNVIHARIGQVLEDGVVTEEERSHLVETLNMLIEDRLEYLSEQIDLTELWFDQVETINFEGTRFCLTGNFVYGPFEVCKTAIEQRGGIIHSGVSLDTQLLVVGGLGVDEWRTGGLGVEIEKAMRLRASGEAAKIIPEDALASNLK